MKINKYTEATGDYTGLKHGWYGNRKLQVKKVPKYVKNNNLVLIINICRQQSTMYNCIIYLFENPQVTKRFPCTSKSDKLPECASNECSTFRVLGSRKSILPAGSPAHINRGCSRKMAHPFFPTCN